MDNEMMLTLKDGKEVKCNIVATFSLDDVNYIAYTDGSTDDDGEILYVSRYKLNDGVMSLDEITSEYEWKKIDKYLDEYVYSEDDLS